MSEHALFMNDGNVSKPTDMDGLRLITALLTSVAEIGTVGKMFTEQNKKN
jgi:hypothetical protein